VMAGPQPVAAEQRLSRRGRRDDQIRGAAHCLWCGRG
jgi:hypothetical protein